MLRRMIISFLALCLALPAAMPPAAMAHASHDPAAAMAHHGHDMPAAPTHHEDGNHGGKHLCIGCAVPDSAGQAALVEPSPRGTHPAMTPGLFVPRSRTGPDTPPPRS